MTLQTLVWIIIWFFALLFIAGTILITFFLGRFSVKDKPNEAAIFVKTGLHIQKPVKGKLQHTGKNGISFIYSKNKIVFVPSTYKENYYHNRRIIFVNHKGQLIASPIIGDVAFSDTEKEDLIYEMCSTHIGADGMKALKGKSTPQVIIIALVAFVIGVAAILGFNAFQDQIAKRQNNTPTQQTPIRIPQEVK